VYSEKTFHTQKTKQTKKKVGGKQNGKKTGLLNYNFYKKSGKKGTPRKKALLFFSKSPEKRHSRLPAGLTGDAIH